MTTKDYKMLAELFLLKRKDIQDARQMRYTDKAEEQHSVETLNELAEDFANRFAIEDPLFDHDQFLSLSETPNE
jgi:hypothetical protein